MSSHPSTTRQLPEDTMIALPGPEALARLVSGVTETMFGLSFTLDADVQTPRDAESPWRTAVLPIAGKRPMSVAIASDPLAGAMLGGAMFSCPIDDVDSTMVEDSLTELVNIVAGQVKAAMGLDQALGLPKIVNTLPSPQSWHSATMKNGGTSVLVWVAICETPIDKELK